MNISQKVSMGIVALLAIFLMNAGNSAALTMDWEVSHPGNLEEMAMSPNQGILMAGKETNSNEQQLYRHDASGTLLWSSSFVLPWPSTDALVFDDGPAVLDGKDNAYVSMLVSDGETDYVAFVKFDRRGRRMWARRIFSTVTQEISQLAADDADNLYVSGTRYLPEGRTVAFLVKYDKNGTREWTRTLGSAQTETSAISVLVDAEGNILLLGASDAVKDTLFTVKFAPDGTKLWTTRFRVFKYYGSAQVLVDPSCNVYVAGTGGTAATGNDIHLVKYDRDGHLLWNKAYDGPAGRDDTFTRMVLGKSGNLYLLGSTYDSESYRELYTLKLDAEGVVQWARTYAKYPGSENSRPRSITLDARENAYIYACSGEDGFSANLIIKICAPYMVGYTSDGDSIEETTFVGQLYSDGAGNLYTGGTTEPEETSAYMMFVRKYH